MATIYLKDTIKKTIEASVKTNLPILLIGETGVGKTAAVADIAKTKKRELIRVSLNEQAGREDLIGKFGLENNSTVWQDGPIMDAVRNGKWVVLDELNSARPEVLFTLHSLLDDDRSVLLHENGSELVKAHKNFRIFATINPTSYHGTKEMNSAFMSRFISVNIEPLDYSQEVDVVMEQVAITQNESKAYANVSYMLRQEHRKGEISYFCSTRDIIMAAKIGKQTGSKELGVLVAVFNKMDSDDLKYVTEQMHETDLVKSITHLMNRDDISSRVETLKKKEATLKHEIENLNGEIRHLEEIKKEKESVEQQLKNGREKRDALQEEIQKIQNEHHRVRKSLDEEREAIAKEYINTMFS